MTNPAQETTWNLSSRRTIVRVTQPLAILAFALGVWLALGHFPGEYDWRYVVISALQSPRDNPQGYHWFVLGMGVSGVLLLPLASHLPRALVPFTPRGARVVRYLLGCGIVGIILLALFTHRPSAFPRLHENLAVLSYVSFVLGLLATAVLFARHPGATLLAKEGETRHRMLALLPFLIFAPPLAASLVQLVLYAFPPADLGWVDITWRERGIPPYLSFAFWEWILSALLYLSGWTLALLARRDEARELLEPRSWR